MSAARKEAHDRYEKRYYISELPKSMTQFQKEWRGLRSIGEVISITERDGKRTCEVLHFISICEPKVKQFAASARAHWGIENSLHWVLNVTFNEYQNRIRKDNRSEDFSLLRRFELILIKQDKSPGIIKRTRKRAGWTNETLAKISRLTT